MMASKTYVNSLEIQLDSEIAALEASRRATALPLAPAPVVPSAQPTPSAPFAAPAPSAPPGAAAAPRGRRALVVIVSSVAAVGLLLLLGILLSAQVSERFAGTSPAPLATAPLATATTVPGVPGTSPTPVPTALPSPGSPAPAPGFSAVFMVVGVLLFLLLLFLVFRRGLSGRATGMGRAAAPLPVPASDLEVLDLRIARLGQIREWLKQDARLRDMVDEAIRSQVLASERRQKTLSVVLSIASLGVGWLLSPINPLTVMAGFLHR